MKMFCMHIVQRMKIIHFRDIAFFLFVFLQIFAAGFG